MFISDLLDSFYFRNALKRQPKFIIVASSDGFVLNPKNEDVADLRSYNNYFVRSFSYCKKYEMDKLSLFYKYICASSYGEEFWSRIMDADPGALVVLIVVAPYNHSVVVTEKYFNDGSHSTIRRIVPVDSSNISNSFVSTPEADIFTTAFDSDEAAVEYLHSKFYLELVEARKRNRFAKYSIPLISDPLSKEVI